MQLLTLEDFPLQTFDKIRYADTDRQGHVNNAVFSSFLETGRVELLYNNDWPLLQEGASFVIASLKMDFLAEMHWPGNADIGTGILKIGNSSVTVYQQIFQRDVCVARAETIIVQVNITTRKSTPLSESARRILAGRMITM